MNSSNEALQLVTLEVREVMAIIDAVEKRHAPPTGFTGSVYSEAMQTCNEIGNAVLKAAEAKKQE